MIKYLSEFFKNFIGIALKEKEIKEYVFTSFIPLFITNAQAPQKIVSFHLTKNDLHAF